MEEEVSKQKPAQSLYKNRQSSFPFENSYILDMGEVQELTLPSLISKCRKEESRETLAHTRLSGCRFLKAMRSSNTGCKRGVCVRLLALLLTSHCSLSEPYILYPSLNWL